MGSSTSRSWGCGDCPKPGPLSGDFHSVRCTLPNSLTHCLHSLFASIEPPLKNESSNDGLFDRNHPTRWITGHDPLLGYPIKKVDGRRPAIPKARDFSMAGARIVEGGHKTALPIFLAHTPRTGKPLVLLAQNGIREWWSHSGIRDPHPAIYVAFIQQSTTEFLLNDLIHYIIDTRSSKITKKSHFYTTMGICGTGQGIEIAPKN